MFRGSILKFEPTTMDLVTENNHFGIILECFQSSVRKAPLGSRCRRAVDGPHLLAVFGLSLLLPGVRWETV